MKIQIRIAAVGLVLRDLEIRNGEGAEGRDIQMVRALRVHDDVALARKYRVVACVALDDVRALAADDDVVARAAVDDVGARAAVDHVVARPGLNVVVAPFAVDAVGDRRAVDHVVALGAV